MKINEVSKEEEGNMILLDTKQEEDGKVYRRFIALIFGEVNKMTNKKIPA